MVKHTPTPEATTNRQAILMFNKLKQSFPPALVAIILGGSFIYIILISPNLRDRWTLPEASSLKTEGGTLQISQQGERDKILFLTESRRLIRLHCEPDPPIDQCASEISGYTETPISATVTYEETPYEYYTGINALIVEARLGKKLIISKHDTERRINLTTIVSSKNGVSNARVQKDPNAIILAIALFVALIAAVVVYYFLFAQND